jgi:hypothetical protein
MTNKHYSESSKEKIRQTKNTKQRSKKLSASKNTQEKNSQQTLDTWQTNGICGSHAHT